MAFCKNCGTQLHDQAVICPQCGVQQQTSASVNDNGSFGWALLGCCVPIAGLILFLIWKDTQPNNAKKAGLGALISVGINIVLTILSIIISGVAVGLSGY